MPELLPFLTGAFVCVDCDQTQADGECSICSEYFCDGCFDDHAEDIHGEEE